MANLNIAKWILAHPEAPDVVAYATRVIKRGHKRTENPTAKRAKQVWEVIHLFPLGAGFLTPRGCKGAIHAARVMHMVAEVAVYYGGTFASAEELAAEVFGGHWHVFRARGALARVQHHMTTHGLACMCPPPSTPPVSRCGTPLLLGGDAAFVRARRRATVMNVPGLDVRWQHRRWPVLFGHGEFLVHASQICHVMDGDGLVADIGEGTAVDAFGPCCHATPPWPSTTPKVPDPTKADTCGWQWSPTRSSPSQFGFQVQGVPGPTPAELKTWHTDAVCTARFPGYDPREPSLPAQGLWLRLRGLDAPDYTGFRQDDPHARGAHQSFVKLLLERAREGWDLIRVVPRRLQPRYEREVGRVHPARYVADLFWTNVSGELGGWVPAECVKRGIGVPCGFGTHVQQTCLAANARAAPVDSPAQASRPPHEQRAWKLKVLQDMEAHADAGVAVNDGVVRSRRRLAK